MVDDKPLPSPFELPRLHVIHLLAWTAAVAAAFVPYQFQLKAMERRGAVVAEQTSANTALGGVYILAEGTLLFIAGAVLVWMWRGYAGRLEPGHLLALQGAAQWLLTFVASTLMLWVDGGFPRLLARLPSFIVGLGFFVWFLALALLSDETLAWRRAFGVLALAPVLKFVLLFGAPIPGVAAMIEFGVIGVQAMAVAAAMIGDLRRTRTRHWSHWLGVVARVLLYGMMASVYVWYWVNY